MTMLAKLVRSILIRVVRACGSHMLTFSKVTFSRHKMPNGRLAWCLPHF